MAKNLGRIMLQSGLGSLAKRPRGSTISLKLFASTLLLLVCPAVTELSAVQAEAKTRLEKEEPLNPESEDFKAGRIVLKSEVEAATNPPGVRPFQILGYPLKLIDRGMEKGLVSFEENYMRERLRLWQEKLRDWGFTPLFGGLGEGSGFGGGTIYTLRTGESSYLHMLANLTFRGYQEYDIQWNQPISTSNFILQTSYQWRPQENFYGLGHESNLSDRTQYALRQTWLGGRWQLKFLRRLKLGTGYKRAWLVTLPGRNSRFPSPEEVFPDLPGFNEKIQLHNVGVFFEADGLRGEYDLGGQAYLEASYQDQLGGKLKYFTYDIELEGRLPLAANRSVLIGQTQIQLNREQAGSDSLPFFLNSRIGGSSTLRGFALDRYSGRNLIFATLEYRYALTPNFQAFIFLDEGQIFNHTGELGFTNWHRNYGLGVKFRSAEASILGLEVGYGEEGVNFHITFGDRVPAPLGGPIRYGSYRR